MSEKYKHFSGSKRESICEDAIISRKSSEKNQKSKRSARRAKSRLRFDLDGSIYNPDDLRGNIDYSNTKSNFSNKVRHSVTHLGYSNSARNANQSREKNFEYLDKINPEQARKRRR